MSAHNKKPSQKKSSQKKKTIKDPYICFCNEVTLSTIQKALKEENIKTLDEIFDHTSAGVGACGGSCRPELKKLLDTQK